MSNSKKVVIALGGSALVDSSQHPTAEYQLKTIRKTADSIADIICSGFNLTIVHGNGSQVGRIILASETARDATPILPFDVCCAMSQGYIGYHLQQSLRHSLSKKSCDTPVAAITTQVIVDKDDPTFDHPSKPIGPYFSKDEAKQIANHNGHRFIEYAGQGYRRVVASPKPTKIVEIDTIKSLCSNTIAIACGGGGIPVIEKSDGSLEGITAVIDKDLTAAFLANEIDADILLILAEIEKVSINYNLPNEQPLDNLTIQDAEKYIKEGHFGTGDMLPKVQAGMNFVKSKQGRKAIITSLCKAKESLSGNAGTTITQ